MYVTLVSCSSRTHNDSLSFSTHLIFMGFLVKLVKFNFIIQAFHASFVLVYDVFQAFILHLDITQW